MAILTTDNATTEEPTLDTIEPYIPGQTQAAETYKAPEVYDPGEKGTVAGQMTGLLAKESPYIQSARESGKRYAQNRGLLNSSIAAGASQESAIKAALPIAQQDAATYTSAGLSNQDYQQKAGLVDIQAGASSQLSSQEATQKMNQIKVQENATNIRHSAELEMSQMLKQMGLSSDEMKAIGSSVTLLGENFSNQIAIIQADPNMSASAKTTVIQQLTDVYQSQIDSIGSIYEVEISWGDEDVVDGGTDV